MKPVRPTEHMLRIFSLATIVALLLVLIPAPVHARDVPFTSGHTIDGNFGGVSDIATADMDGDGDLDVLGAADNASDIAWWENTAGDGTTWSKQTVDGWFKHASSVAAADLDGDGDMDILGAAFGANDIAWWENMAGDGSTWSQHTVDSSFFAAWDVVAADVDGDGDMDVLGVGFEQSNIAWWENSAGDGSIWSKHSVTADIYLAYGIAAADVDGDGDVDVLGASGSHDEIAWWENWAGDGSAWSKHTVELSYDKAYSVAGVDVDGDGDQDILGGLGGGRMTWWENTAGNGSVWSKHTVNGGYYALWDVAAADVDGDGDMDLLGAAWTNPVEIAWWENTAGDGSAWSRHSMDASHGGWNGIAAADVDGDGDVDILGNAHDDNEITWWENETIHRSASHPVVGETVVDADFDGVGSVAAADVDGDGDLDILGAAEQAENIAWWENTAGDGSTWSEHTVHGGVFGPWDVAAADVDGDGDPDVLYAARGADDISWWENVAGDGSAWSEHSIVDANFAWVYSVAAADLDGDGDLDVLGAAFADGDIAWWENTAGDGSAWSRHSVDVDFDGAASVAAADVDGDGDMDVLGAAHYTDDIAWWENSAGDGSAWSKHSVDADFDGAQSVAAADMDGDGDMDVLGAALYANDIAWWENTAGDGSVWSKYGVAADFDGAYSVATTDADGDGDLDVLGAAYEAGDIAWWENTAGDGSAWSKHGVAADFDGAVSVAAADVDGDGDPDVLGAANIANDIAWWENRGGQFALATSDTAPAQLVSGQTDDLLKITMTHRGRSGDGDEELATLELLFEERHGDPLTSAEANAVIGKLAIYLDDGSGVFEIGSDTLVATVDSLALNNGVQTVAFAGGDANVQVQFGTPRTYFVVVEIAADAYSQTAIDQFRVTHITESSSTAQDRDHDIPLILEYAVDVASSNVAVPFARIWDGGGTTQNWSEAANWVSDIVPRDALDGVRFDSTSSENAIIDAGFSNSIGHLTIASSYSGQIAQDAGLTVSGDWNQDGGTFTGGSSTLDIGGAFDLTGGTFTAPTGLMSVGGGFHHSGGTFDPNGGRVVLDNTGDQTLATAFHDLYVNDGLLGYWKLDEGSGTTAADSSGYGHDGALHRSPVWSTDTPATHFGNPYALHFDRSDADYVSIAGTSDIDDLQQLTLATWVKLDTMPAGQTMRFVTLRNEKAVLRYDGASGSGQLHFYVKIDGSFHSIRVNDVLSAGVWLHVAGTYDGSTVRLYLNGTEQAGAVSVSGTVATGDGVHLSWSGSDGALNGLLDDMRVYNRALSGTEIQALAAGKHPETSVATTTLGAALDVNGDLTLNSGTLDVSANNYTINVGGDFIRNGGVFTARSGAVIFDGSGTQSLDTDAITFHDLTVEEGATVDLGSATTLQVDGAVANNGGLKQSKEVDGSNTAFLHVKDGSGTQDRYFGLEIDPGIGDMGSAAVTVWGNQLCPRASDGVLRCFELEPTTPLTATVRFYYTEAERNGQDNARMTVYHSDEIHRKWDREGGSYERGGSGDGQYVQVTDVDEYSPFALSDSHLHEWREYRLYLPIVGKR